MCELSYPALMKNGRTVATDGNSIDWGFAAGVAYNNYCYDVTMMVCINAKGSTDKSCSASQTDNLVRGQTI